MLGSSCVACGSVLGHANADLYTFPNITSDCRPWKTGRSVAVCPECGIMQRVVLPEAVAAFRDVYENYEMFSHSSSASDQINFGADGSAEGRTQKILKFINTKLLHSPASVLDIGSGSGAGLIALANQFTKASIYGFEPNDRPAERQKYLPDNVVSILNVRPSTRSAYDLITLFHVFEHVEDLFELLDFVRSSLTPTGHLLIQVPYPVCGAFDLVIADHIWHFSKKSIVTLLRSANFDTVYIGNDVIEKELTVLAAPSVSKHLPPLPAHESLQAQEAVQWLIRYKTFLDSLKIYKEILIYGTGPAAAWVGHVLGDSVRAYLDDDAARVESVFNGKPVLSPKTVDSHTPVIAPFPDKQAAWIAEKNRHLNILLFKPDTMNAA